MKNDFAIEIENLQYSYPDGRKALDNISFIIEKNDTVGLIGPNGAGKSTLIMHMNGLLMGKGHIKILNLSMEKKYLKEIRKSVGIVFQDPDSQLFMPTVFDDIAFGPLNYGMPAEEVKEKVSALLESIGLVNGFEDRFPHHLSTGEKKRVAIATILAMDPKIIIFDEPTSNLDPKGKREFISLLKNIKGTKIIATHDLEMVLNLCNKVIVLNKGRVVAHRDTVNILSDEQLLMENDLEMPLSLKFKRRPSEKSQDNYHD